MVTSITITIVAATVLEMMITGRTFGSSNTVVIAVLVLFLVVAAYFEAVLGYISVSTNLVVRFEAVLLFISISALDRVSNDAVKGNEELISVVVVDRISVDAEAGNEELIFAACMHNNHDYVAKD